MGYFKRSLKKLMVDYIINSGKVNFSHKDLMEKKSEFASIIPYKFVKKRFTKAAYYAFMNSLKHFLREEHQKVLFCVRGDGYRIADDYEKEIETYKQLEQGILKFLIGKKILITVQIENLTDEQKSLFHSFKGIANIGEGLTQQLLTSLKENKQLPEAIANRLEKKINF